MKPEIIDRNKRIVDLYQRGLTQNQLAAQFNISRERVRQILRVAGQLDAKSQAQFIRVHLAEPVRTAMRAVAESEGKTISKLISELVYVDLKSRGVTIPDIVSTESEPSLPLDE